MKAYADTSFLCSLYRRQHHSEAALAYRKQMTEPLHVTRLLLWEFRQGVRFQAFRHARNRQTGYPLAEAEKMIAKVSEHLEAGIIRMVDCDFTDLLITSERLSKSRTHAGGHRSFDILHVATALVLGAEEFLTFDENQRALAAAEGLATPLAAAG